MGARKPREPALIDAQRAVLLERARVVGVIGLIVVPFTIIAFLAFLHPGVLAHGVALSAAAVLAIAALNRGIRRGTFDRNYHLPMLLLLGGICNLTEATMLQLTGGSEGSLFFFPYFLICFGLGTLFPGDLAWIAGTVLLLAAGFVGSEVVAGRDIPNDAFVTNLIQLADYGLITCIGNRAVAALFFSERKARLEVEIAHARLEELDKAKTRFFANVSHELRTPLTLVLAPLASVLRDAGEGLGATARDLLQTAHGSASHLLSLINDILLLSRLDAAKVTRRSDMVDVDERCADIARSVRARATQLGLTLVYEPPQEPLRWIGDASHLQRILLNLLSNACKFSKEAGQVTLRVTVEPEHFVLAVSDQGIGIPADDLERIFGRFEQVEHASNRRFEGTGIGLSLVKELSELHGGTVKVSSEVGVGSTFEVRLVRHLGEELSEGTSDSVAVGEPLAVSSDVPDAGRLAGLAAPRGNTPAPVTTIGREGRPRVVVVDDNPQLLGYLRSELARELRVTATGDSVQALELALSDPPDMVLSDVMMPVMDGLELARRLRADPRTRSVPIILLSARGELDTKLSGFAEGVDDYLQKPFQFPELKARIELHLRLRAHARELSQLNGRLAGTLDQLRAAEVALVQKEKMAALGTVIAGVAHEINNPLHFATGQMWLLRRELEKHSVETPLMKEVEENLQRMSRVTKQLFTYAQTDRGERELLDLDELVSSVLKMLRPKVKEGVVVTVDVREPRVLMSSPQRLYQVLTNLIENALHAARPGDTVTVRSGQDGDTPWLAVEDTGPGIPADVLPRVFEPFFTTKPAGEGTGLGLAIVQRLTSELGASIDVASEPGRGTTVRLDLPIETRTSMAPPAPAVRRSRPPTYRTKESSPPAARARGERS